MIIKKIVNYFQLTVTLLLSSFSGALFYAGYLLFAEYPVTPPAASPGLVEQAGD